MAQKPDVASTRVMLWGGFWLSVFFLSDLLYEHELYELMKLKKTFFQTTYSLSASFL